MTRNTIRAGAVSLLWTLAGMTAGRASDTDALKTAFSRMIAGGDYVAAVGKGAELLAVMRMEKTFGTNFESISYVQALAFAFGQTGEAEKADLLFNEALDFAREFDRKGGTPPQEAIALLKLANHRTESGRSPEAEDLFGKALELQRAAHGEASMEYAEVLNNRGVLRERTGRFDLALGDLETAYRIRAEVAGGDSPDAIDSLWNLSYTTFRAGNAESAVERLGRFIDVAEAGGGGGEFAGKALEAMELRGRLLRNSGAWAEARQEYERGLAAADKLGLGESLAAAKLLRGLAGLEVKDSKLAAAEEMLLRALGLSEKAGPSGAAEVASLRVDLAGVYQKSGRMRDAVPLLESVLRDLKEAREPDHDRLANTYTALGICYGRMGDFENAREAMASAVEENGLAGDAEDSPERLVLLSNLANVNIQLKDYERAADLQEKVLALREATLEADNPYVAESLESLAMCYEKLGREEEAENLYLRAIAINEKRSGRDSIQTATGLNNLADFYRERGQYTKAVVIGERVLAIVRKLFGEHHRYTATAQENLGYARFGAGDREGALASLRAHIASSEAELADILAFGTEAQRIEYLGSQNPWTLPASLGAARELATLRLRQKGLARDSLIEDRMLAARSSDPEVAAAVKALAQAKIALRQSIAASGDSASRKVALGELHAAERALTDATRRGATAREALELTVEELQRAIPEDSVLVDYISYRRFAPGAGSEQRFDALVLRGDRDPVFVSCAGQDEIDALVETYLQCAAGATDDETTAEVCGALYEKLIAPLVPHFAEGTTRLIVSADGLLHRLSFATLMPDPSVFLGSRYAIQYADSARDLLVAPPGERDRSNTLVLVGDPAFGGGALASLPATRREVETIQGLAKGRDWKIVPLLGGGATETALRKAPSPRVLHLATHGFYLDDDAIKGARIDAMFRSGIALSGASGTLQAWQEGAAPEAAGDGVLTADEVADLDCAGTWLVTLSACDSGTGKLENGEGVIGLRRGFALAGAENVLMTLWPVRSDETADFMEDFYRAAFAGGDAAAALRDTQRDWLERLLREKGALQAFSIAGPFILARRAALGLGGE